MVRLRSPAPILRQSFGGIPERPKGADCKSVVTDFAGPNPASPTKQKYQPLRLVFLFGERSVFEAVACIASIWSAFAVQSNARLRGGVKRANLPQEYPASPSPCDSVFFLVRCDDSTSCLHRKQLVRIPRRCRRELAHARLARVSSL